MGSLSERAAAHGVDARSAGREGSGDLPLAAFKHVVFPFYGTSSGTREQGTKFCAPSGCRRASRGAGAASRLGWRLSLVNWWGHGIALGLLCSLQRAELG